MMPELGFHRTRSVAETLTPMFPGAMVAVWLLMLSIATSGALALLHFWGALRRPTPLWIPVAFGLAILFVIFGDFNLAHLGQNAALALLVPMFLVGTGTFHAIARRTSISYLVIAVFYGFMVVFPPPIAVVALIRYGRPNPRSSPTLRDSPDRPGGVTWK